MSFTDKTLVCRDCDYEFTFTAGEQDFYAQKGFTSEPTRCASCRQARKQQNGADRSGGRDYADRGGYGSRSSTSGYGGDRAPREMHTTTCSGCGQAAEVPFVPSGNKPVYCRSCFQSQRAPRAMTSSRW